MGWGAGVEGVEVSVREGELETTPTDVVRWSSCVEVNNNNNNNSTEKQKNKKQKNRKTEKKSNRVTE